MIYKEIDKCLMPWAQNNNIELLTMDRDWEIRSFVIGSKYVFIDYPKDGTTKIKIYNNNDRKFINEITVTIDNLVTELDKAVVVKRCG